MDTNAGRCNCLFSAPLPSCFPALLQPSSYQQGHYVTHAGLNTVLNQLVFTPFPPPSTGYPRTVSSLPPTPTANPCPYSAPGPSPSSIFAASLPVAALLLNPLASLAEEAAAEAPPAAVDAVTEAQQQGPTILSYAVVLSPLLLYGRKAARSN